MLRLLAVVGLAALALGFNGPATKSMSPNVLLVVLDDVADSDINVIPTPNFDTLAAQGVRYRNAYANPLCAPTRRSMLFGIWWGKDSGAECEDANANSPLPGTPSLPNLFRGMGYTTGLFGKWHLGGLQPPLSWSEAPLEHGFDNWRAGVGGNLNRCGGTGYEDWTRVEDGVSFNETLYQPTELRDSLLSWIDQQPGPWLAVANFALPHPPLHEPPPSALPPGYVIDPTSRGAYEAMVTAADTILGDILATIDLTTTIVAVVGDNGTPPVGRRPGQSSSRVKGSVYVDGVRVPFAIAGPGVLLQGVGTKAIFHVCDLPNTLAELAGNPLGLSGDGISQVPVLTGSAAQVRRYAYCVVDSPIVSPSLFERAIYSQTWCFLDENGTESLYRLKSDPQQQNNRINEPGLAELAGRFRAVLANP